MIREKIQYGISIINVILTAIVIMMFDKSHVIIVSEFSGEPVLESGKWVLMVFGTIPLLFIIALSIFLRKILNKPEYQKFERNKNEDKNVMPSLFVILLFVGWIAVVTYKSRDTEIDVRVSGWLFMALGAAFMYLSNYFTRIKTDSRLVKFIPDKYKDESLWNRTSRLVAYSCAVGGYVAMLSGVAGIFLNSEFIAICGIIFSFFCFALPNVAYAINFKRKSKKRREQLARTKKK